MIVAHWYRHWCLAQHVNLSVTGCSLRLPKTDEAFARLHGFNIEQFYSHKYFPSLDGIRFFPIALWRSTPVFIDMWSHGQDRLHVGCTMNPAKIDQHRWFGRTGLSLVEMIGPCAELGLRLDVRDHAVYGAVPFDELELIEGPPPGGTF